MGLLRGKIKWTIPGAGTAFTVLHFGTNDASTPTQADATNAASKMNLYCTSVKAVLPSQVTIQPLNELEEIVEATGDMLGVYGVTTQTVHTGAASSTASWAAAAGAVITWSTGGVRNSRRVRGRSFVVPMSSAAFDVDGTIAAAAITSLGQAAANLRDSTGDVTLAVYARPTTPGGSDGAAFPVLSHRIPDMSAILRSRRS